MIIGYFFTEFYQILISESVSCNIGHIRNKSDITFYVSKFPPSPIRKLVMWVRHKCTICNGTGKIKKEDCQCEIFPEYLKIFPNAEWQNTSRGITTVIPSKCLVYAVGDMGCILINDWSEVRIAGVGVLPQSMTPRTINELNALCSILKLRILYLESL